LIDTCKPLLCLCIDTADYKQRLSMWSSYSDDSRWLRTEPAADTIWEAKLRQTDISSCGFLATWSAWLINYVGHELGKPEFWCVLQFTGIVVE